MEVSLTNNNGYYTYAHKPNEPRKSTYDTDMFMKLLTTQLSYQDPFKPMDNAQMQEQIAQIANIQNMGDLTDTMKGLEDSMATTNAVTFVGKKVTGVDADTGAFVSGQVTKLTISNDQQYLSVIDTNGQSHLVTVAGIREVIN
ncbi:MAG: flagellar hook capping FlgD N-terminal domain-containing protein [Fimbriimonadaceae bacterium]